MTPRRPAPQVYPVDVDAERGLIGAVLEMPRPVLIDASLIANEGRRVLFLAADRCRLEGHLFEPAGDTAAGCYEASTINAAVVREAVLEAGVWPRMEDPAHELAECQAACTQWRLTSWYADRIAAAADLAAEIEDCESRLVVARAHAQRLAGSAA